MLVSLCAYTTCIRLHTPEFIHTEYGVMPQGCSSYHEHPSLHACTHIRLYTPACVEAAYIVQWRCSNHDQRPSVTCRTHVSGNAQAFAHVSWKMRERGGRGALVSNTCCNTRVIVACVLSACACSSEVNVTWYSPPPSLHSLVIQTTVVTHL